MCFCGQLGDIGPVTKKKQRERERERERKGKYIINLEREREREGATKRRDLWCVYEEM
jgi:hypothetical protein